MEQINVKLKKIDDIFNSFDDSSFMNRSFNEEFINFLANKFKEKKLKKPEDYEIVINLEQKISEVAQKDFIAAFKNNNKKIVNLRKRKSKFAIIQAFRWIILSSAMFIGSLVIKQGFVKEILGIGTWVLIWELFHGLLIDIPKRFQNTKIFYYIMKSSIKFI